MIELQTYIATRPLENIYEDLSDYEFKTNSLHLIQLSGKVMIRKGSESI